MGNIRTYVSFGFCFNIYTLDVAKRGLDDKNIVLWDDFKYSLEDKWFRIWD